MFICNIKEMIGYEVGEVMRLGEIVNISFIVILFIKKNFFVLNKYY